MVLRAGFNVNLLPIAGSLSETLFSRFAHSQAPHALSLSMAEEDNSRSVANVKMRRDIACASLTQLSNRLIVLAELGQCAPAQDQLSGPQRETIHYQSESNSVRGSACHRGRSTDDLLHTYGKFGDKVIMRI